MTPTPPPPTKSKPYSLPLMGVGLLMLILACFALAKHLRQEEAKGNVKNPVDSMREKLPLLQESRSPIAKLPPAPEVPQTTLPPVVSLPSPAPTPPPVVVQAPITLFAGRRVPQRRDGAFIAPRGRQVICRLVTTVDSGSLETPIIGLVLRPIHAPSGQLLIPENTEVHFIGAKADSARDRIAASGRWTFIIRDGTGKTARARELAVEAVALDHEYEDTTGSFALTDGSAGLRGEVIRTDQWDQVLLFASTALGGLAEGLKTTTQTVYGTQAQSTFSNAGLNAGSSAIQSYAQQILDRIKKDGSFVRVGAGKSFILYVKEPIDLAKSSLTGDALASRPTESRSSESQTTTP